jgi:hypothetical protein
MNRNDLGKSPTRLITAIVANITAFLPVFGKPGESDEDYLPELRDRSLIFP